MTMDLLFAGNTDGSTHWSLC